MANWLTRQIERIPQPWRFIAFCFSIFALTLIIWFYGTRAFNGFSSWMFQRNASALQKQIDEKKLEAAQAKQVAADALAALAEEKKVTEVEREKRQLAEELLADKTKTTNEKLRLYEEAMGRAPVVSPVGSIDELCERARKAGIECGP